MAKASTTPHTNAYAISIKFDAGNRLEVFLDADGVDVAATPLDVLLVRKATDLLAELHRTMKAAGVGLSTIREKIVFAAAPSEDAEDFLIRIESEIGTWPALEKTQVAVPAAPEAHANADGRGWIASMKFPNGDAFEIKVLAGSIDAAKMIPNVRGLVSVASRTTFGLIKIKRDPKAVAEFLVAVARQSASMEDWLLRIDGSLTVVGPPVVADESILARGAALAGKALADTGNLTEDEVRTLAQTYLGLLARREGLRVVDVLGG